MAVRLCKELANIGNVISKQMKSHEVVNPLVGGTTPHDFCVFAMLCAV